MILLRYGNNSSLGRSQSIGNVLNSHVSSLSVSPLSFSSEQLHIPRAVNRRRSSIAEQVSDRSSGSTSSLGMPMNRLDFRRHSASPEPLIQRLSSFSSDRNGSNQSSQFVEEEETKQNFLSKPFDKMNGHSSQEHHLQHDHGHQRFLSMTSLGTASYGSLQPTHLSYQHHHSSDNIDGNKLTFKAKGLRKISADNNNLFTNNSNVQLLSSKKIPQELDVRWEVRTNRNSLCKIYY